MSNPRNVIANRYEVIKHIGQGGMADVFKGIDMILDRDVAIKILRADLSGDEISILRFEREAQAATALAHPNIVEIYDVGDYRGHHYIVMEYVPGRTLKQVIRGRGPLLKEEAVDIMKQLTSAVAEAHSRGIIHRDIKPQNVIVKSDGSVKILDFGIATAKGSMQLTQANNVMGSVHYLAPELARGDQASPQSDIYALGICLFEMLAKDVPFKADQAVQVALKHLREPMPRIRSINPNVPQSIENIIMKATAKDPSQRYASCRDMYQDLVTCLDPRRANEPVYQPEMPAATTEKAAADAEAQRVRREERREKARQRAQLERERKKTKKLNMIIAVSVSFVLVAGIMFTLFYTGILHFGSSSVVVPDLVGKSIAEAKEICEENHLSLETVTEYQLTENIEKGLIISVTPDVGSEVDRDSAVNVIVSSGIGVRMIDFVAEGMNVNQAEEFLSEQKSTAGSPYANVSFNMIEEKSSAASGTIIRQEGVTGGTLFNPDVPSQVTLYYSAYPDITIPENIIGMPIDDAISTLEGMGLVVRASNRDTNNLSQDELDELEFGVVIDSDPAPGASYSQKEKNFIILYYY